MIDLAPQPMSSMDHFLRGRTVQLSEPERTRLEGAVADVKRLPAKVTIVERGQTLQHSTMLMGGFMVRFIDDLDGLRQIVAFHVPGDFVDLHGFPLKTLDHGITTLTPATIALVPHRAIEHMTSEHPDLARKLWFSTLLDAAMHREWLFRLGRLDAMGRVAHFLAETNARLKPVGLSDGKRFGLPITQSDLADISGLTPIHVNRVLRALREDGICVFRSGIVDILDETRLINRAQFDPTYLYLLADDSIERPLGKWSLDDG